MYFPVYISLKNDGSEQVFSSGRYSDARVCGEKLAKVANVDLHDVSEGGATQVRKPEELDETVQEKLRKKFSPRPPPNVPLRIHTKTNLRFESLTIDSPRFDIASLGPMKKALWGLFIILGGGTAVAIYLESYIFAFFGAFIFAEMLYAVLRSETITLTRDNLAVRTGVSVFKRTQRIPFSELEELFMSNVTKSESKDSDKLLEDGQITGSIQTGLEAMIALGSSIKARSDHKSITFGRILSQAELDHILFQIERWIRH